ncbi:MAG: hypothetical protein EBT86_01350 [Actinobacteria bacterium]|nr:hypothetical protein [Actinomycetota bacterium]NDG27657.1 hypothetical protein [Pseudomonadota bacterium]
MSKSTNNVFFKMKSSKRSNPETRAMLDAIHAEKIANFKNEKEHVNELHQKIAKLNRDIESSTSDIIAWQLERQRDALLKELKLIETSDKINDYYLRSGDILFNYYEAQEKIQSGEKPTGSQIKAKPGSILAILEEVADDSAADAITDPEEEPNRNVGQRNDLLNQYLIREEPEMAKQGIDIEDPWTYCEDCGAEMNMCLNEALLICPQCGYQDHILVDSDKPSYKDPPRENSYYAYKKINHFNELLAQFQAKENTEIPQEIYDNILVQLKKERITDMSTLTPKKLREILRKLKCAKYYEHIPHIMNRLNGQNAPHISRENEEKLRHMFREIQPSFVKHKQKGRRNFLSYSYVLYKFCELLEMDEFLNCFLLLKNRDKLYAQDKTWQKICQDMNWQYIRTT